MKLLIIETNSVGHPIELVPALYFELTKLFSQIDTITPFPERFGTPIDNATHYYISTKDFEGHEKSQTQRLEDVIRTVSHTNNDYDLVFFFTIDSVFGIEDQTLVSLHRLLGRSQITGIYYSSSYWRIAEKQAWCRKREEKLALLHIKYLYTPDPAVRKIKEKLDSEIKYIWLPDFTTTAPDQSELRLLNSIYLKSNGRKVVGLVGSLGKWKGVLELTNSLVADPTITSQYLFFISGEINRSTFSDEEYDLLRKNLDKLKETCLVNDRNIDSSGGFNALFQAVDFFICVYNNPQSSGIFSKAIRFGKPVLGSNQHYIGDMLKAFPQAGVPIDELNSQNLQRGLSELSKRRLNTRNDRLLDNNLSNFSRALAPENAGHIVSHRALYRQRQLPGGNAPGVQRSASHTTTDLIYRLVTTADQGRAS